jgi:uncharacterized membrane protein YvbJ
MPTTLLEETKSKRACPSCGQNKLITNDSEKFDDVIFSHCLNCGCEFSENEQQRKFHDSQSKKEREDSPLNTGMALLFAMIITILVINISNSNTPSEPGVSPSGRVELRFS